MEKFPEEELIRYMKVAFFCTQAAANRRPLMSQVVQMLSRNIRLNEKELTAPGLLTDSGASSSKKGSVSDSTSYQMSSVPVTITEVTPRWGYIECMGLPLGNSFFFLPFKLHSFLDFFLSFGLRVRAESLSLHLFPFSSCARIASGGSLQSCG